jgi:hypothetical protein
LGRLNEAGDEDGDGALSYFVNVDDSVMSGERRLALETEARDHALLAAMQAERDAWNAMVERSKTDPDLLPDDVWNAGEAYRNPRSKAFIDLT